MDLNQFYEEITDAEANFIIELHQVIDELVRRDIPVTLVRLGFELDIKPVELQDYLQLILSILKEVEEKYSI